MFGYESFNIVVVVSATTVATATCYGCFVHIEIDIIGSEKTRTLCVSSILIPVNCIW